MNIAIVASLSQLDRIVVESSIASLVDMLRPLSRRLFIIGASPPSYDDEKISPVELVKYGDKEREFVLLKLFHHFLTDLKLALTLFRLRRQIGFVIYYVAAKVYPLSELLSKLMRKKVIVFSFNPLSKAAKASRIGKSVVRDGAIPPAIMGLWDKIVLNLADHILVESEASIDFSNLRRFGNKISVCPTFYVDPTDFRIERDLRERTNVVGFIGRLVEQKGILNLVRAIPIVLSQRAHVEFVIGGEGPLRGEIENQIGKGNLQEKVHLLGFVPRAEIPHHLNQLKLFVLPSYTEGLPRAVQEAMACGAIVLATPVGGVPDLIRDGETGFILQDNSPQCIARNITRALEHPDLEAIAQNGRTLIEQEYTYEVMVEKLNKSLGALVGLGSKGVSRKGTSHLL